eukprot:TRINITY_DN77493_c0_g1_i1.p1 TRINITY_DN77493_c0_g1~~TRINITY_DN77493_c0_g1_i1.p1  ORF type:complete len:214 (-),score=44.30 TRINITY_DN77493_c0_g1_i1:137-727(-)
MDPALAEHLARQRQRSAGGGYLPMLSPRSAEATRLDPVLAERLAKQARKEVTGESAVENVGSAAEVVQIVDPLLAERLAQQALKVETGESAIKEDENKGDGKRSSIIDKQLSRRLSQQLARLEGRPEPEWSDTSSEIAPEVPEVEVAATDVAAREVSEPQQQQEHLQPPKTVKGEPPKTVKCDGGCCGCFQGLFQR